MSPYTRPSLPTMKCRSQQGKADRYTRASRTRANTPHRHVPRQWSHCDLVFAIQCHTMLCTNSSLPSRSVHSPLGRPACCNSVYPRAMGTRSRRGQRASQQSAFAPASRHHTICRTCSSHSMRLRRSVLDMDQKSSFAPGLAAGRALHRCLRQRPPYGGASANQCHRSVCTLTSWPTV